jgi:hypothetical protein
MASASGSGPHGPTDGGNSGVDIDQIADAVGHINSTVTKNT